MAAGTSEALQPARFPLRQHVEVLQKGKDLRGSWQLATIVAVRNGRREVEYERIFQGDGVHKLRESFSVRKESDKANKCWLEKFGARGFLRPLAPVLTSGEWPKGLLVDAFEDGAWWEGVVSEDTNNADMNTPVKVLFPDRNKESVMVSMQLRASHQWDDFTGKWEVRGYWKGFCPSGGKDTSYREIQSMNWQKHHKGLALSHAKDAEAGTSSFQEDFKELIKRKRDAARQFLINMGYTLEFHHPPGRGREAVYIAPNGRRFYSLTMACKTWKKEQNMPCNLGACKSNQERLLCIYDLLPSPVSIECTQGSHKEINVVVAGPFSSKGEHRCGRKHGLGAEAIPEKEEAKVKRGRKPKFKGSPLVNQGMTGEDNSLFCLDRNTEVNEKGLKAKRRRKSLCLNEGKGISSTAKKRTRERDSQSATTSIPEELTLSKVAFLPLLEAPCSKQGNKVSDGCQNYLCDPDDRGSHSPASTITEASKGCRTLLLCHSPTSAITEASKGCRASMLSPGTSSALTEVNVQVEGKEKVDDICSACGDGGDLVLCDCCPSAYHADCVGLEVIPEGNWYCFGCCCTSCEGFLYEHEDGIFPFTCTQCQSKYHVKCSPSEGHHWKQDSSKDRWFCGLSCEQVYVGLYRQLGISYPLEMGGLSWMLLKSDQPQGCSAVMRSESKLSVAHTLLQECFIPMIDVCTGVDIISQALFSQGSKMNRLNCVGFYTLILERGCELISVATFRVHGSSLAEMPFIGTQFHHRRKGMCRQLMSVLEKMLQKLGLRKLLLPAVPELLKTWRQKFGFQFINSLDRKEIKQMNLMRFPGTYILKKNMDSKPSGISSEYEADFRRLKRSRNKTQLGDLDAGDAKVVVATTRYKRLVKSPQWYVDSMKILFHDVELLGKERRLKPCRRKLKKTMVDAKKRRRWANHATEAFRSRFRSSTLANANLDQGMAIYDSMTNMPFTSDVSTFLLYSQDPPTCAAFYTRKPKGKPFSVNSSDGLPTSQQVDAF